jgi:hypothetical protein
MNRRIPIAVVVAGGLFAASAGSIAAHDEEPPEQAPVEFTVCINLGPEVHRGTEEQVVVSLPDGELTIDQFRDWTWRQSLTDASDPRLDGTIYHASNADVYTLPGNEAEGPEFAMFTKRIENDEGAWEGSAVLLSSPDGTTYVGPTVMTGEGAYEGLTAIIANDPDTWAESSSCVTGYIIEGSIPAPPVPQTGQ